jgi:non-lysosomal glucosylceramidase
VNPPYSQTHGYHPGELVGLPHFESSVLKGEYPFVWVDFVEEEFPVIVSMEAFTPFIPLNADDSGIPGAVIRYKVKNKTDRLVEVTIAGSIANLVGFNGYDDYDNINSVDGNINEYREEGQIKGINYSSAKFQMHQLKYGSMALMTSDDNITFKHKWLNSGWWDGIQNFWDDFSEDGKLNINQFESATQTMVGPPKVDVGSLGICKTLQPGEEKIFEFALTWHFPNRIKSWDEDAKEFDLQIVRNYYSTLFKDAWHAGYYMLENIKRLEKGTRDFHGAMFNSTLPAYVIDAVASNITVIRSNTCFRIEEGTFLAYEGCHNSKGSCEGTCTHVWNYAQTLAFLFPELERTARKVEFNMETDDDGSMAFRTLQIFGKSKHHVHPAADGQMGTIIRLYREWKISGDSDFLISVWEKAVKALEFAFTYWDMDGDYVLDGQQHNTYDIEFYGPNSLTNSLFYAALKAGGEMAEFIGDYERAEKYRLALEQGSKRMDELLWNGEFYIQKLEDVNQYSYQYGEGCLSDQLLGQLMAHVTGLGYILPESHVKETLKSIFKYNFQESMKELASVQRVFALNDEKGLLLCSWPKGGRPKLPFVYSDEVWTGVEYQVAAHLIYEGLIDEGLSIVKAVRDRYDGYRRNPWDEVECGHHYARSLASWAVLLALSGFKVDLVKGEISFKPVINQDSFSTFWSTGKAWGVYKQQINLETGKMEWDIDVLYGTLDGVKVNVESL